MKTSRPYLIRAMHEWIIDCDLTPYALVDANHADVIIPRDYIDDGKILLNVSPGATQNLNLGNEFVIFSARFSGKSMEVSFPVEAVLAVYAKENGRGMMFKDDEMEARSIHSSQEPELQSKLKTTKPHSGLVGVKSTVSLSADNISTGNDGKDSTDSDPDDSGPNNSGPASPSKKPSLKIVK